MPAHQHLCLMAASVAAVSPARPSVAVVGAGVSGLNCAKKLQPTCDVTVFEASDGVGGRVRSDRERGYVFDRGFAVFLCLLYTSPSPRDGLLSRMPSSA